MPHTPQTSPAGRKQSPQRIRQRSHARLQTPRGDPPGIRKDPNDEPEELCGRWRIVSMEIWDADAIDLVEPGFIQFNQDRSGQFGLIAVQGWMDCREATRDGRPCVEFTWDG